MEESTKSSSDKQRKKKIEVSGGGGVGGILLLGGALVAAALIATFTHKASKRRPNTKTTLTSQKFKHNNSGERVREQGEGLLSVLHPSSFAESHRRCRSRIGHEASNIGSTQIDFFDSVAIETQIMEEKSSHEVNSGKDCYNWGIQEIVSDNSQTESVCTSNDHVISEDQISITSFEGFSSLDIDLSLINQENINKENPSVEIEEEKVEQEEDEIEVEEGSEGTGDSSIESNADAIWPPGLELKERKTQVQVLAEKIDKVAIKAVEEQGKIESQQKKTGFMMVTLSRSRFCLWSMLAVGLLLVLLAHHLSISYIVGLEYKWVHESLD